MRIVIWFFICAQFLCCGKENTFPSKIIEYTIVKKISGSEAQKIVNQIHLQPVAETESEIGFYENGPDKAFIYITYYKSEEAAQVNLLTMINKISPDNSVFIDGGKLAIADIVIYRYFGMGQTHYTFRIRKIIIWISVDTMIARDFLESYLNKLQ